MSPAIKENIASAEKCLKSTASPGYNAPDSLAHFVLGTTPANYQPMIDFNIRLLNAEITCGGAVLTFLPYDYQHHRIAII